ncbi:MAG: hypothetical protein EOP33_01030 [Rickettsiaceae bacterium]|nr:MAG: hypothetical protein EOP33_01030 [Rickettsiaceae bacterium]
MQVNTDNKYDLYDLQNIFDKAINRTWYKSHSTNKINELRELLHLAPRISKLENHQYDKEIFDKLKEIDFSPLDGIIPYWHNTNKFFVLNFSGIGFIAAEQVITESANIQMEHADQNFIDNSDDSESIPLSGNEAKTDDNDHDFFT